MLKFKTNVKINNFTNDDLILFLEEIWDTHYFSFDINRSTTCHCFKINDDRIKSNYTEISSEKEIVPQIIDIKNNHFIEYYSYSTPLNVKILKTYSTFQDNVINVYRIEKFIDPVFTVSPFEWALSVIKNNNSANNIIKPFQVNLASSILYWSQHLITPKNTVVKINPIYKNKIKVCSMEHGFYDSAIDENINISNIIQIDHPCILIKRKPNTFAKNMLYFWQNKVNSIGDI